MDKLCFCSNSQKPLTLTFRDPKQCCRCISASEYINFLFTAMPQNFWSHRPPLSLSLSLYIYIYIPWLLLFLLSLSPLSLNLLRRGTSPHSLPIHQPFASALVSPASMLEFELPIPLPKWSFVAPLPSQVCLVPHWVWGTKGYNFIRVFSSFQLYEKWVVFNFCFFKVWSWKIDFLFIYCRCLFLKFGVATWFLSENLFYGDNAAI